MLLYEWKSCLKGTEVKAMPLLLTPEYVYAPTQLTSYFKAYVIYPRHTSYWGKLKYIQRLLNFRIVYSFKNRK